MHHHRCLPTHINAEYADEHDDDHIKEVPKVLCTRCNEHNNVLTMF